MFDNEPFIIKKFTEETISEGIDLADSDAVIQVDLFDDPGLIKGKVEENGKIYTAQVSIDDEDLCTCSCGKKFCRHQAAILVKATGDYSKNFVEDAIDDLEDEEAKEILKNLLHLHPELTTDLIPMLLDFDDEDIQELLGLDHEEEDDDEQDEDINQFMDTVLDLLLEQDYHRLYFTIIDFIDHLFEEDEMDIEKLEMGVDLMIRLYGAVEFNDAALFSRINQWIDAHQKTYLEKYDINLTELVALQDFSFNNPYALQAREIAQSNYLNRGPSTANKVVQLIQELMENEEMPESTKGYSLDLFCSILGNIYKNTSNQRVKRSLIQWYEALHDQIEELGVFPEVHFFEEED